MHAPMEYHADMPIEANDWPKEERAFASMLMSLDKYVGEIVAQVDELGLGENTLIVFTSDNGAHNEGGHDYRFFHSTGDYRGFKRDLYDGGMHTPMLVRWTGTIPEGSQTNLLSAFGMSCLLFVNWLVLLFRNKQMGFLLLRHCVVKLRKKFMIIYIGNLTSVRNV